MALACQEKTSPIDRKMYKKPISVLKKRINSDTKSWRFLSRLSVTLATQQDSHLLREASFEEKP
jgi:hypothetical protein